MDELITTVLNGAAKIFNYFYEEWGWSGVLFLLFWGGVGIFFVGASVLNWITERLGKRRE
jgi:hypothetical protein